MMVVYSEQGVYGTSSESIGSKKNAILPIPDPRFLATILLKMRLSIHRQAPGRS